MLEKTEIVDCYLMVHQNIVDERGGFCRLVCTEELEKEGVIFHSRQTSIVESFVAGTIRGMHFQKAPKEESKIATCLQGAVFYVVVDLRKKSKTFKKIFTTKLDERDSILIPKGCASGYQTLMDGVKVLYHIDELYDSSLQSGVNPLDGMLNIPWKPIEVTMSEKDRKLPNAWVI